MLCGFWLNVSGIEGGVHKIIFIINLKYSNTFHFHLYCACNTAVSCTYLACKFTLAS